LFYANIAFSQNTKIDSLMRVFLRSEEVNVKTFDLLFIELHPEYMEELSYAAEILRQRATYQNNLLARYRANDAFGMYHLSKGAHQRALNLIYQSVRYYEKQNLPNYKMKGYVYLAHIFYEWGSYQDAIHWFLKALPIAEENPNEDALFKIRGDIGLIYLKIGRKEFAKKYLDKNKEQYDKMITYSQILHNNAMAIYNNTEGNHTLALAALLKSTEVSKKHEYHSLSSSAYSNLGIATFENDVDLAKVYFDSSYYFANQSLSPKKIALAEYNLASWYYALGNTDSAIYYFNQSFNNYYQSFELNNAIDALEDLSDIYRNLENWSEVDRLQKEIMRLKGEQYESLRKAYDEMDAIDKLLEQDLAGMKEINKVVPSYWIRSIKPHLSTIFLLFIILVQSLLIWTFWRKQGATRVKKVEK
jgi:tetratricopeptide (TPR) repeat protein